MKVIGVIVGLLAAMAFDHWAPVLLRAFAESSSLLSGISAVVGVLTSLWLVSFGRLTAFEKLDDLTGNQKAIALEKAKQFRRAIIQSLSINAIVWVITIVFIVMAPTIKAYIPSFMGFWLLSAIGIWGGGFAQSIRCLDNIEASRLAITATQEDEKRRAAYLKKMREDEAKSPVRHDDSALDQFGDSIPRAG